jgi:hypothetical protein
MDDTKIERLAEAMGEQAAATNMPVNWGLPHDQDKYFEPWGWI